MNVPQSHVKMEEAALTKLTVTLAIALMGIMEPTVKPVIIPFRFKFIVDISIYSCVTWL